MRIFNNVSDVIENVKHQESLGPGNITYDLSGTREQRGITKFCRLYYIECKLNRLEDMCFLHNSP